MSDTRTEEPFHYYTLVAGRDGEQYRAVGWPKPTEIGKVEAVGSTLEEAIQRAKTQALEREVAFVAAGYAALEARSGVPAAAQSPMAQALRHAGSVYRNNHCHRCKLPLFGTSAKTCSACDWLLCPKCGSCGCSYAGPIKQSK